MTDHAQPRPPTPLPTAEDALRRSLLRVLMPAGPSGPGRSLADRIVLATVLCLDEANAKTIGGALGFDADLTELVISGLVTDGSVVLEAGRYRLRRATDAPLVDDIDREFRRIELLTNCPVDSCEAVMGTRCVSRTGHETTPHTSRRRILREMTDNGIDGSSLDGARCA